jgi:hypothetical protein
VWCGGRWLLQQGREAEAKEALRTIRQEDELDAEITAVRCHNRTLLTEEIIEGEGFEGREDSG